MNDSVNQASHGLLTDKVCPKCGSRLLANADWEWCSFAGGRHEPACTYRVSRTSGLTPVESEAMRHLVAFWNTLVQSDEAFGTEEMTEIQAAVHRLQDVLIVRVVARQYPSFWQNPQARH